MSERNILEFVLDTVQGDIARHVYYGRNEMLWFDTLWNVGTYFMKYHGDIRFFDAFPYKGYMSPEVGAGKTRALEATAAIIGAEDPGTMTRAAILDTIDELKVAENPSNMIGFCLDNIDPIFDGKRDNAELAQFLEVGYSCKGNVKRMDRFKHKRHMTPAYCPKAFSGLKAARLTEGILDRTAIIDMDPKPIEVDTILEDMDDVGLRKTAALIKTCSEDETIKDRLRKLTSADIPEAAYLNNRARQVMRPILGLGKVAGNEWYLRALAAVKYFTSKRKQIESMPHRVLRAAYYVFRKGDYPDKIRSFKKDEFSEGTNGLLNEIWELGIPKYVTDDMLAVYLDHYQIYPNQFRLKGNKNPIRGYTWEDFQRPFKVYIDDKERHQVEVALGLIPETDVTAVTEVTHVTPVPSVTSETAPLHASLH